jgi:hypothetical protein
MAPKKVPFFERGVFVLLINKKNMSSIRNKTFYLQFCMETPKGHQNRLFSTSKVKRSQKFYKGYPTKFAGSTQDLKKYCRNIKSTNQNEKFPKKSMFSTLKV